jgi:hypothetical protein
MVNAGGGSGSQPSRVAAAGNRSYVDTGAAWKEPMPAIVSSARLSRPLLMLALVGGLIMAATLSLWAFYGTAVFFEIVRTGWVACF